MAPPTRPPTNATRHDSTDPSGRWRVIPYGSPASVTPAARRAATAASMSSHPTANATSRGSSPRSSGASGLGGTSTWAGSRAITSRYVGGPRDSSALWVPAPGCTPPNTGATPVSASTARHPTSREGAARTRWSIQFPTLCNVPARDIRQSEGSGPETVDFPHSDAPAGAPVGSGRDGRVLGVRSAQCGRGAVLRLLRRAPCLGAQRVSPRSAQDGDGGVHRSGRLDRAGLAARPGGTADLDEPLLRGDAGAGRASRREGRQVHRRRGGGVLRRSGGARGRCAAGRAGGGRDARRPCRAQRGPRSPLRRHGADPHRRQHRRRARRRRVAARLVHRRRRRQRRRSARATRGTGRGPAGRDDLPARAPRRPRRAGRRRWRSRERRGP